MKEGDPQGKHCILVDDLVQSGGTLLEAGNALIKHGAKAVSAYVTHAVFPKRSWTKFLPQQQQSNGPTTNTSVSFQHFFITNSIPAATELDGKGPFKVLSIARLCASFCLD